MKRITYQGQSFDVPEGYNWIAADNNGEVWAYREIPVRDEDGVYVTDDSYTFLGHMTNFQYPLEPI